MSFDLKTAVAFESELKSCIDMPRDMVADLGSGLVRISRGSRGGERPGEPSSSFTRTLVLFHLKAQDGKIDRGLPFLPSEGASRLNF